MTKKGVFVQALANRLTIFPLDHSTKVAGILRRRRIGIPRRLISLALFFLPELINHLVLSDHPEFASCNIFYKFGVIF